MTFDVDNPILFFTFLMMLYNILYVKNIGININKHMLINIFLKIICVIST